MISSSRTGRSRSSDVDAHSGIWCDGIRGGVARSSPRAGWRERFLRSEDDLEEQAGVDPPFELGMRQQIWPELPGQRDDLVLHPAERRDDDMAARDERVDRAIPADDRAELPDDHGLIGVDRGEGGRAAGAVLRDDRRAAPLRPKQLEKELDHRDVAAIIGAALADCGVELDHDVRALQAALNTYEPCHPSPPDQTNPRLHCCMQRSYAHLPKLKREGSAVQSICCHQPTSCDRKEGLSFRAIAEGTYSVD